jgi:hypothetical protein
MDFEAIQQGLADAADVITGLQCLPSLSDAIDPPTFAPTEVEGEYDQTFSGGGDGMVETLFTCGVFTSRGDTEAGRALLVGFINPSGATSVKAALQADKTLGGAAKTLHVGRFRGMYRLYQIGGVEYLGALIDVRVWA